MIIIIELIFVINSVRMEVVSDQVKVRNIHDANGAEFYTLDTLGLIEKWGYTGEEHSVVTEDEYILKIFRIPWSLNSSSSKYYSEKKPVILMQTVLAGCSDNWVLFGPNRSLAMQLADEGYDVWLGNYRGNIYGRNHIKLSANERKFWDFSYHEIGIIDLRNTIDYILNKTNSTSMIYLGHSVGSTSLFVLLSQYPEYNNKLKLLITFTPVAIWKAKTLLRSVIVAGYHIVKNFIEPNGSIEVIPQSSTVAGFFKRICIPNSIENLCLWPLEILSGKESLQFEKDKLVEIFSYLPAGTSLKTFYHYAQSMESGKFSQYNYNDIENTRRYNKKNPPEYNLKNIKSPLLIFYSKHDPLSTKKDVEELSKNIASSVTIESVKFKDFTHVDFFLAKDIRKIINNPLIKRLEQYKNNKIF